MNERNQNQGNGQQPPLGKQDEEQMSGQSPGRQQSQQDESGQQRQQQQGGAGSQQSMSGESQGGASSSGMAGGEGSGGSQSQIGGSGDTLMDEQKGGQSDLGGASDLGGGATGGSADSGFVGTQGEDSGEYLREGQGASESFSSPDDPSGELRKPRDEDSDIEGSSGSTDGSR